ncbi:MAG: histidine phosphatase family protein [bacterium]|jgi:phosphohistidine phosphatase
MKRIYIARHASAAAASAAVSDFDRPLLPRGQQEAGQIGARLAQNGSFIDYIICSPALRARETAEILARNFAFPKEKIVFEKTLFDSPAVEPVLQLLKGLDDDFRSVLVCGHNPVLQQLAATLSGDFKVSMPAGTVVGISFELDKWRQLKEKAGKICFFASPEK